MVKNHSKLTNNGWDIPNLHISSKHIYQSILSGLSPTPSDIFFPKWRKGINLVFLQNLLILRSKKNPDASRRIEGEILKVWVWWWWWVGGSGDMDWYWYFNPFQVVHRKYKKNYFQIERHNGRNVVLSKWCGQLKYCPHTLKDKVVLYLYFVF